MKKVLVILAAAGMLFAMSSCSKECKCKTYVDGEMKHENTVSNMTVLYKVFMSLKSKRQINSAVLIYEEA